jgi:hypothetical protein
VDYLEQISCVLVDGVYLGTPFAAKVLNRFGVTVQIAKRNELHTVAVMSHGWVVERAFTGLGNAEDSENCEPKLSTILQLVKLAFLVLLLRKRQQFLTAIFSRLSRIRIG